MSGRTPRSLPVVQSAVESDAGRVEDSPTEDTRSGGPAYGRVEPDAGRLREGWTYRFVAGGVRAAEMIRLYRRLGYDVAADPVRSSADPSVCTECYEPAPLRYRAIYTRPRGRAALGPVVISTESDPGEDEHDG